MADGSALRLFWGLVVVVAGRPLVQRVEAGDHAHLRDVVWRAGPADHDVYPWAEARGQGGEGVVRATRHLARHLVRPPGGTRRVLVRDDRVRDEPVVVELALGDSPAERAGTIAWWVDLQRVATVGDGADPAQVVMESTERVRSGSLP